MKKLSVLLILLSFTFGLFANGGSEEVVSEGGIVTIDWFVNEGWFNRPWDSERPVDAALEEYAGVNINFLNSSGGGTGTEKLNAMIAADDLPDVVTMGWWYAQVKELEAAGMLQPLNEIIPEMTPTFYERVPRSMQDWYRAEDGNWYNFPNFYWAEEHLTADSYIETNASMVARKDIMDDLGIVPEDFETQEGMIAALTKVKEAGLEYNGLRVAPLYFTPNGGFPGTWVWDAFFALPDETPDGQYLDSRKHPKYLEQMYFANELYRAGLLSMENWTLDRNGINEKIVSGSIFMLMCNTADYAGPWKNLYLADPAAEYVAVGPLRAKDGAEPVNPSTGMNGWLVSGIAHDTNKTQSILNAWDWLYSMDGLMSYTFGVEGDSYNMVDGRVAWTDKYIDIQSDPDKSNKEIYGNYSLWLLHNPLWEQPIKPAPATMADMVAVKVKDFFSQWTYNNAALDNLNPDGGSDEAAIAEEIRIYWEDTQVPKMIMADSAEEVKMIYDESIDYITSLGWEDVQRIQNEKFQANKAKLGVDHIWPAYK